MKIDTASFLKRVAPRPHNALKAAAYSGLLKHADPRAQNYRPHEYVHLYARFYKRSSLDYFILLNCRGLF
jgi:hypothetical protein